MTQQTLNTDTRQIPPLQICGYEELLAARLQPRQMLLAPWLPEKSLCMVYAARGIGKTYLALSIAHAVASGGKLLGWQAPKPVPVLYIDGEMPAVSLQERCSALFDRKPAASLEFIAADLQEHGIPDLASREFQEQINEFLPLAGGNIKLVIVDNLSSLVRSGKENEAESWIPIQEWALGLKRMGVSVLFIHHASKSGTQRGTSRREDLLDTLISLRHPKGYKQSDGAVFEVNFEKARGACGTAVAPFCAALRQDANGRLVWVRTQVASHNREKVLELHEAGSSLREIASELKIGKSTVERYIKDAERKPKEKCSEKPKKKSR